MAAKLAITSGEPAGIGPDICLALPQHAYAGERVVIGDRRVLEQRAGGKLDWPDYDPAAPAVAGRVSLWHIPTPAPVQAGTLDTANAAYVLDLLKRAVAGCQQGEFAAMVTAPVHKGVINQAGVPFSGHTEFLAERTGAPLPVMMLTAQTLRVALVTTHLPLADVSAAITPPRLTQTLRILDHDLRRRFGIDYPRILVCGLNPHAGEGGYLGHEEIDIIEPCLAQLRAEGLNLTGPLPADTLFTPTQLEQGDAVLAMYHDQGLPVLKHVGFGQAVNITLGLSIVRTSVDHGTALDLAGTGQASAASLHRAVEVAATMATP